MKLINNLQQNRSTMENKNVDNPADHSPSNICPLCRSEVKYFFLNFNEKLLMCENTDCEFPFGHEELQFIKEDNDVNHDAEVSSIRSSKKSAPTHSYFTNSIAAWSDVDRIERVNDLEDKVLGSAALDVREYIQEESTTTELKALAEVKLEQSKLKQNLASIKDLNTILATEGKNLPYLRNEKWIKNLSELQNISGAKLVKPEEVNRINKDVPIQNNELKIEYVKDDESGTIVTIQINNA